MKILCGKLTFSVANSNSLRQIQIHHGKFKFPTANSNFAPYNVSSVLWRMFSTLEVAQYIGGITSILVGNIFSTVGDNSSTCGGDSFSTVRIPVLCRLFSGDKVSTVGDSFSPVEDI